MSVLFITAVLGFGILSIIYFVVSSQSFEISPFIQTEGKIVAYFKDELHANYFPIVEYVTEKGDTLRFKSKQALINKLEKGTKVILYYNQKSPNNSAFIELSNHKSTVEGGVIFTAIVLILISCCIYSLLFLLF
ncbi:DUF3592 domain-containing protein [Sediminitomix flava]|uniref:Uncharacterized protein DUF3592 n=1 Tax=Sediminitomix flava TaxID=379075 RepID=A0A315ZI37_SEDFL|nr:DUF3592 domain-containing protein [Sediminitomix flava]PWJ44879.1 uncharacterized protein DUF3592 [Sediminitomix flava]